MRMRNNDDKARAELGRKWMHLLRPFPDDGYPFELASVPIGWLSLLDKFFAELDASIPENAPPAIDRLQVKNGHLEIWWMFSPHAGFNVPVATSERVAALIERYEDESSTICGICGGSAMASSDDSLPICDACVTHREKSAS